MTRFVHTALLAAVLLSPLPFGSIHPMAYTALAIIVAILVGLCTAGTVLSREEPAIALGRIGAPALLFAIAVSWAAIQSASWTPISWHNPVWAEASAVLGKPLAGAVSIDPFATRTSVMRLLCYAGIFWLAFQLGRSARLTSRTFAAVAVAGLVYAAYGLFVEFTGSETILWFEKERYRDFLTSTFRYKNAYAAFAGIGLLCTAGLLVRRLADEDFSALGPREFWRSILTLVFERIWYLVLAFVLMFSALALSGSRGGFIALICAFATFFLCIGRRDATTPIVRRALIGAVGATGGRREIPPSPTRRRETSSRVRAAPKRPRSGRREIPIRAFPHSGRASRR